MEQKQFLKQIGNDKTVLRATLVLVFKFKVAVQYLLLKTSYARIGKNFLLRTFDSQHPLCE